MTERICDMCGQVVPEKGLRGGKVVNDADRPYLPSVTFVHPRIYTQRSECPDWTNRPNALHAHNADCIGFST